MIKCKEGGVWAYEKANEVKRALSDVLVGKCKNEYDVLLIDEKSKKDRVNIMNLSNYLIKIN